MIIKRWQNKTYKTTYIWLFLFCNHQNYIIIYVISAIGGSLLSSVISKYASVGASSAIFGLMGALLYFGYHYRVYLGNVIKSQIIPIILINLFIGFMFSDSI